MLATVFWLLAALGLAQPSSARGVAVSGVVQDQTGAVLPGAEVALIPASGDAAQTGVTDGAGVFRFERVAPGTYDIRTEFPGFTTNVWRVRVGGRAPAASKIVMTIEGVKQEISVTTGGAQTSASAAANLNAIAVDGDALDNLPVLDQDVVGAMTRFLDSTAIGTRGTTILVDGVEVNALAVSASAVQQIKINQDPYAAEFMRPGRGRIEIVTKPGGPHGDSRRRRHLLRSNRARPDPRHAEVRRPALAALRRHRPSVSERGPRCVRRRPAAEPRPPRRRRGRSLHTAVQHRRRTAAAPADDGGDHVRRLEGDRHVPLARRERAAAAGFRRAARRSARRRPADRIGGHARRRIGAVHAARSDDAAVQRIGGVQLRPRV